MRRLFVFAFVLVSFAAGLARAQDVSVSKLALMNFDGNVVIDAPATAVWSALTDADKAMSWCPLWKSAKNPQALTKVGNSIAFVDQWNNAGKSVVILADAGRELRLAHVPDDGSYVCQVKIVLAPSGSGTKVSVTEQYSDALDAPTDKDTALTMQKEIGSYLTALKSLAEKK
ncbi:MAG TPA: SRPBCC domain-containing protein [Candidatus Krumholzibacteria bacterium]|nr:SRPBCC domain-containing protein [Candidatus Krumholzibacteria bacterium]